MKRLDAPVLIALLIAIAYGVYCNALLERRKGDISLFVVAGGPGVDPGRVPRSLTVEPASGGYDGVAFYRLALDPFTTQVIDFGIELDNPPYRQQRIGYPLLVHVLSLGNVHAVPALMVAVNLLALIAIAWCGARLAQTFELHAVWGATFALHPGFLMSLSRDTSEIVACAFALAGLLALRLNRPVPASLLLAYAVVTRETTLVIVFALFLGFLWRRSIGRMGQMGPMGTPSVSSVPLVSFVVPSLVYAAWQFYLGWRWGTIPLRAGAPGLAAPFAEYLEFFGAALSRRTHIQRVHWAECALLALITILALIAVLRRNGAPLEWRLAWLGHLALAATLPAVMWVEHFGFLRIVADLFLMSAAVVLPSSRWVRGMMLLASAGVWHHVAKHLVAAGG
ncbi:MAG TPA: hypothetical protein VEK57_29425 [Thermoanaerobaculia bacterium]|nr:hypothetical protein [Thermoanaerobaculia bacterium]